MATPVVFHRSQFQMVYYKFINDWIIKSSVKCKLNILYLLIKHFIVSDDFKYFFTLLPGVLWLYFVTTLILRNLPNFCFSFSYVQKTGFNKLYYFTIRRITLIIRCPSKYLMPYQYYKFNFVVFRKDRIIATDNRNKYIYIRGTFINQFLIRFPECYTHKIRVVL